MDLNNTNESAENKAKSIIVDIFDNILVEPKDEKENIKLCHMLSKILCDSSLHPRFGHDPVYFKDVSDEIDNVFEDYL
tara:strand:+ start:326 stop:559 length:234 start_codon:yes stop_codon:yes gene_type:complete